MHKTVFFKELSKHKLDDTATPKTRTEIAAFDP